MTDLRQSLIDADLSHIRAIADSWGIVLDAPDARRALDELVTHLISSGRLVKLDRILSSDEIDALVWLNRQGGREPWNHFTRRFGEVRELGAGTLERVTPQREPVSPAEALWYKALVGRGFFDSDQGPQEFAYLPEEIRNLALPVLDPDQGKVQEKVFQCRVASQREIELRIPANLGILNHLTTLLAGFRMDIDPACHLPKIGSQERRFYEGLLASAGLVDRSQAAQPAQIGDFFDLNRSDQLAICWKAWRSDSNQLELELMEGIEIEGEPEIDLPAVRKKILDYLDQLEGSGWWSLESFISQIKTQEPDILRLGGDYESWFIRDLESGEYLQGFQSWDAVEGKLIRMMITGPLYWLGAVDLGAPDEGQAPLGFKLSGEFSGLSTGGKPDLLDPEFEPIQIRAKGEIRIPEEASPKVRYQVARFCEWGDHKADAYLYSISPDSLGRAEKQGLKVAHLLALLKNNTRAIPPSLSAALKRWEKGGLEVQIAPRTIVRLGSPAVLKALQKSPAGRYIEEQLGPTVVIIRPGSAEKVAQALMELGFLVDWKDQDGFQT